MVAIDALLAMEGSVNSDTLGFHGADPVFGWRSPVATVSLDGSDANKMGSSFVTCQI